MTTPPVSRRGSRAAFVQRLSDVFEQAGVEYVLLHDHDDGGRDSDIDIAVSRPSLDTVDTLIRLGYLGRLLQRIDYDIPWSRYYVVQTGDVERPYRQIDVACDPWDIGRYGPALGVALASRRAEAGMYVASAAAQTFYLAVKRSRKGLRGQDDRDALAAAFGRDRHGATALLEAHFALAGADLAAALNDQLVTSVWRCRRWLTLSTDNAACPHRSLGELRSRPFGPGGELCGRLAWSSAWLALTEQGSPPSLTSSPQPRDCSDARGDSTSPRESSHAPGVFSVATQGTSPPRSRASLRGRPDRAPALRISLRTP